jgi:hypothetical protein
MNSMNSVPGEIHHGMSRRSALGLGGAALAAFAVREPFATAAVPATQFPPEAPRPEKGLRVATCQFPVSGSVAENARHICDFMRRAQPYSHFGSFVARPDATIAQQLPINEPGMLVHDFPDGLSKGGWYHNERPLRLRDDELMSWGQPSQHPRELDSRAEP